MRTIWGIVGSLLGVACFFDPQTNPDDTGSSPATGDTGDTGETGVTDDPGPTSSSEPPTSSSGVEPTTDKPPEPICGDFMIEEGEECDNGLGNNGGGGVCRDDCTLNTCGDGYLATSLEGCDDGNTAPNDGCDATCQLEGCGDGVQSGEEECDDGNDIDDDECTNLCKLPVCGDGIVSPPEECDDANNTDEDACTNACRNPACGDGIVSNDEACDDGNAVDDDECSNACVPSTCGDGMKSGAEECDDGNSVDEDDCLSNCALPTCGDGFVHAGVEVCDDADPATTKVCAMCKRSAYYVFVSSAKFIGGAVGSPAMADLACTMLSVGTAVEGTYMAWVSSNNDTASARLFHADVPYILPNGNMIANDWADLIDGTLDARINRTEKNNNVDSFGLDCQSPGVEKVWTGTAKDGSSGVDDCKEWTQPLDTGLAGVVHATTEQWTAACQLDCTQQARFFCFEQPPQ